MMRLLCIKPIEKIWKNANDMRPTISPEVMTECELQDIEVVQGVQFFQLAGYPEYMRYRHDAFAILPEYTQEEINEMEREGILM